MTRWGLLAVSLVLALALGEAAARLATRDVTSTGHIHTWLHRRWASGVHHNTAGFRERERPPADEREGIYRIAVLGDSITYGPGIPRAARFTERLEAALNRVDRRFEVRNYGVPGSDTPRQREILRDFVLPDDPDFVLLQWYVNDVLLDDASGVPGPPALLPSARVAAWLRSRSALYFLVEFAWAGLSQRLGLWPPFPDHLAERFADPSGPDARAADRSLAELIAASRSGERGVALVLFPQIGAVDRLRFLHERVEDRCQLERVECIDLSDALDGNPASLTVSRFDRHPGPLAHEVAAAAILEQLGARWRADARAGGD